MVLKSENKDLKQRIIQQEAYDRRKNLIFHGICYLPDENTFAVVGKFLQSVMKVKDGEKITFDNCYRLKSNQKDKPPPMIVRFVSFRDRDVVWKCRRNLAGTSVSVAENFPQEIELRRKSLYPVMKKAKDLKHKAYMVGDKLIIDDKSYNVDTLHMLPQDIDPASLGTKTYDDITAFCSANSPLSNFHKADFIIQSETYPHVEQYLQYNKARHHEKLELACKIRSTSAPLMCKRLGDSIAPVSDDWLPVAQNLVMKACEAKFLQNDRARNFLKDTGKTILAEATLDIHWGVGLRLEDDDIADKKKWKGKNTLGDILMKIRDNIV